MTLIRLLVLLPSKEEGVHTLECKTEKLELALLPAFTLLECTPDTHTSFLKTVIIIDGCQESISVHLAETLVELRHVRQPRYVLTLDIPMSWNEKNSILGNLQELLKKSEYLAIQQPDEGQPRGEDSLVQGQCLLHVILLDHARRHCWSFQRKTWMTKFVLLQPSSSDDDSILDCKTIYTVWPHVPAFTAVSEPSDAAIRAQGERGTAMVAIRLDGKTRQLSPLKERTLRRLRLQEEGRYLAAFDAVQSSSMERYRLRHMRLLKSSSYIAFWENIEEEHDNTFKESLTLDPLDPLDLLTIIRNPHNQVHRKPGDCSPRSSEAKNVLSSTNMPRSTTKQVALVDDNGDCRTEDSRTRGIVPRYEYESLPHGDNIRLLELLPASASAELQLKLSVHNIHSHNIPPYIAVSYTWNDSEYDKLVIRGKRISMSHSLRKKYSVRHPVWCDGCRLLISTNLKNALRRFRQPSEPIFLWVDALCINQEDLDERANQVAMMIKVYHSAQKVWLWLGESDEHSEDAVTLLSMFAKEVQAMDHVSSKAPSRSDIHNPSLLEKIGLPLFPGQEWKAVYMFFQRPVFHRIWIIQELVVSRRTLAHCGPWKLDFDDLLRAVYFLDMTLWGHALSVHYLKGTGVSHISYLRQIGSLRTEWRYHRKDLWGKIIHETRYFGASDPRDKIYALLGLLSQSAHDPAYDSPIREDHHGTFDYPVAQGLATGFAIETLITALGKTSNALKAADHYLKEAPDIVMKVGESGLERFTFHDYLNNRILVLLRHWIYECGRLTGKQLPSLEDSDWWGSIGRLRSYVALEGDIPPGKLCSTSGHGLNWSRKYLLSFFHALRVGLARLTILSSGSDKEGVARHLINLILLCRDASNAISLQTDDCRKRIGIFHTSADIFHTKSADEAASYLANPLAYYHLNAGSSSIGSTSANENVEIEGGFGYFGAEEDGLRGESEERVETFPSNVPADVRNELFLPRPNETAILPTTPKKSFEESEFISRKPNYRLSVAEVYRGFTLCSLIDHSSLSMLYLLDGVWPRKLPIDAAYTVTFYNAGGLSLPVLHWSEEAPDILCVQAYQLDKVRTISCLDSYPYPIAQFGDRLYGWLYMVKDLPEIYHTGQSKTDALWRTVVGNSDNNDPYAAPAQFSESWEACQLVWELKAIEWRMAELGLSADFTKHFGNNIGSDSSEMARLANSFEHAFNKVMAGRRLCVTQDGYFGAVPMSTRPGDLVYIFKGGNVPFVVRESKEEPGTFTLLAGCYLHGFMDGEALNRDDFAWQNLRLH
ncbi:hypothetical protein GJ744_005957 [Endocarpon pusillum]|uniref:Heterokaryon incompatibility domain-containing protein n=1 Tax=Endocarpon pusillum TaxID=364733 RepID=A0A8H7AMQ3_9EURO|nr:hypothetical protein GJ744_005957 [Endocarpon pusillum]